MKKAILFLLLVSAVAAEAQQEKPSLKDLLYSGKLKLDSNSVVRKGDDLSSKIDTSTKKPPEAEKPKMAAPGDASLSANPNPADSSAVSGNIADSAMSTEPKAATITKNNNQIWKEYADSLISTLKTEVLSSKKIKKETYYVYVDYEIGTDGQVNLTNITTSPENEYLQQQIKQRLLLTAPQLTPVVDSNNKPRKVKRKFNFNITKE